MADRRLRRELAHLGRVRGRACGRPHRRYPQGSALRAHWLDVAIVVLTVPLFGQLLSSLRLVRLARLLRLLRAAVILSRAIQAERRLTSGPTFRLVALVTVLIVVVAGGAQAAFNADEFGSVWDGVWWAIVTVTTVGYGDLYPSTVEGRLIGIVVMLVGIARVRTLSSARPRHFDGRGGGSRVAARPVGELGLRLPDNRGSQTATPPPDRTRPRARGGRRGR